MTRGYADVVAGVLSGICQSVIIYPMDTLKVRLQTQKLSPQSAVVYHNAIDCAKKIFRNEGVRGYFRGMSSMLCTTPVCNAVLFAVYGQMQRLMHQWNGSKTISAAQYWLCGGVAGGVGAYLYCPIEAIKVRMQMQYHLSPNKLLYRNPIDCGLYIIKHDGVLALYRGLAATIWRDIPGTAAWYGSYEMVRTALAGGETPHILHNMTAGSVAGAMYWVFAYPQDLVKSRLQTNPALAATAPRTWSLVRQVVAKEGWRGLYAGFSTCIVRSGPSSAVLFGSYQYIFDKLTSLSR
eukprot:TRINITY_DN1921_c0_g1_i2.p1 TRINITY_DN1921_c0_g1~~TRINITY_DN1921_c0_g1_i2.p1  ORF type:complete len:293 (+),score=35.48 TRINITY_DN1921_c0_g1_i2:98-976(+)